MRTECDRVQPNTPQEITREYFEALGVKKANLLEQAKRPETRSEFMDTFDHIIRINRIQLGLLAEMYLPVPQEEGNI